MPRAAANVRPRDGNFPVWTANVPFRLASMPLGDPTLQV